MVEPLRTWKDWQDQLLHALCGAFLTFAFAANLPLWGAASLTMAIALWREVGYQHWMTCNAGCRTDLLGWLAGVLPVCLFLL